MDPGSEIQNISLLVLEALVDPILVIPHGLAFPWWIVEALCYALVSLPLAELRLLKLANQSGDRRQKILLSGVPKSGALSVRLNVNGQPTG